MGITFTKYETGDNIVFDVSKFDHAYDDDTFPVDAGNDFDNIITEAGGNFDVTRETDTLDGMGGVTNISDATFSITGWITDINKKDYKIHSMGLAVPGNRTIYVKDIYGSDVVKEGDVLTDRNSNQWKIVTIIKEPFLNRTEIYKKAVIKSIGLEGSN